MSTTQLVSAVRQWDHRLLDAAVAKRTLARTRWMIAFTRIGDGWAWVLLGIAIALFDFPNGKLVLARLGAGLVLQVVVYRLLKIGLCRQRPYQRLQRIPCLLLPGDPFSFPSGHSSVAFFVLTVVAATYTYMIAPLLALSMLIAISRVYLGVHYPSDVVAGMCLGVGCGVFAHLLI